MREEFKPKDIMTWGKHKGEMVESISKTDLEYLVKVAMKSQYYISEESFYEMGIDRQKLKEIEAILISKRTKLKPEDLIPLKKYSNKTVAEVYSFNPKYIINWVNTDTDYYVDINDIKAYYLKKAPEELRDIDFSDFD